MPALYSSPGLELEPDTSLYFQGFLFDLNWSTDDSDVETEPSLSRADLEDGEIELNLFIN